jgi:hypothetical protein
MSGTLGYGIARQCPIWGDALVRPGEAAGGASRLSGGGVAEEPQCLGQGGDDAVELSGLDAYASASAGPELARVGGRPQTRNPIRGKSFVELSVTRSSAGSARGERCQPATRVFGQLRSLNSVAESGVDPYWLRS